MLLSCMMLGLGFVVTVLQTEPSTALLFNFKVIVHNASHANY